MNSTINLRFGGLNLLPEFQLPEGATITEVTDTEYELRITTSDAYFQLLASLARLNWDAISVRAHEPYRKLRSSIVEAGIMIGLLPLDSQVHLKNTTEPYFLLRGQDVISPSLVRLWADFAELHGVDVEKVAKAREVALHMDHWEGPKKKPD